MPPVTVHPRVRGEHRLAWPATRASRGSSPRARGTPVSRRCSLRRLRFIPACAGNTRAVDGGHRFAPVHPRVRGEHRLSAMLDYGAPVHPRVRGEHASRRGGHRFAPVHPRVRGEHARTAGALALAAGSSPRARGTHIARSSRQLVVRFIPACAGNTFSRWRRSGRTSVHPRVRGEHDRHEDVQCRNTVHPRVRGEHSNSRRSLGCPMRFIPACAGNTIVAATRCCPFRGSSPRARGTRPLPPARTVHVRFIPACAGNTVWSPESQAPQTVHPRVRGEHRTIHDSGSRVRGSSPRARGTRDADRCPIR